MSKQVSDKRPMRDDAHDAPMMPKAERRAAGKLAAKKRAAARRRKKALQNVSVALAGIGVVVVLVIVFGGFGSDDPAADPLASAAADPQATAPADPQATPPGPAPATAVPDDFDPALKSKPEVTAGEGDVTELKVTTLVEGDGAAVRVGQTLSVNYVGVTYADGQQFDSSWDRGQPATFALGEGLIEGWVKGLDGVKVGSRVQLDIPVEMAYNGAPDKPPGDLRFVVDILSAT